jgi:hypothetical protein
VLESAYIPFDGPLSFAAYYLNSLQSATDWRLKYLSDTLIGTVKDMPSGFRASYMLPAQWENTSRVHFWTPYETRVTMQLQGTQASLLQVTSSPISQVSLSIKINKRNDLEKVLSWRELSGNLIGGRRQPLSGIESGRGPYRNVALDIEIKKSHLLWISIVEANNKTILEDCLRILEQLGIGKKRYAGWGDLHTFSLHNLQDSRQSVPSLDWQKLIYRIGSDTYLETLRPLSTKEVSQIMRSGSGYLPLDIKFTQGAERPPYWRNETIVEYAKLLKR